MRKTPIGEMRARGPDLLAVDQEMLALVDRAGAAARGRAGAGLGIALAPELVGAEDRRQKRCFCASLPQWIGRPSRLRPLMAGSTGARAAVYSSSKMICWMKLAPRPPNSLGQESPTQPAACMVFCQAMRFCSTARSGAMRWSAAS